MFLTRILCAAKSRFVLVMVESTASGHQFCRVRERKEDKLEFIWFDPLIRQSVVYTEIKKMKGINNVKDYVPDQQMNVVQFKKPWEL